MAKQSGKQDPEDEARRKLAKAQLKLHVAEEEHAQTRERGKQEVEKARLRAGKRLAKAAQRVERRAQAVARAEARLLSLSGAERDGETNGLTVSSPQTVAGVLEQVEVQRAASDHYEGSIVLPEGVKATAEAASQTPNE
jgi:hypothetical protein